MDLAKLNIEINSKDALTANKRLGRLAVTGRGTEKSMVSLATSSRKLSGRLAMNARRFKELGALAQRIGRRLTIGLSLPLAGIGAKAAQVASKFEKEMTRINTLVGLSSERVSGFTDSIMEMAKNVGRGPQELARALFTVTSAGARGAESLEILEQAAKASAIGLGDTRDIAKATTAVLQAYGKENVSAARATEILVSTVREGNLEASELAPVLGRVLGMASNLGISFEELGANVATFTRLGVSAEEAVTGLRGVMNALMKPTSEGAQALDEMGISFSQLREAVDRQGLAKTMRELLGLFDGNQEALSKVIPNVRALANVLGTAGAQGEEYSGILENIITNTGLVEEGFETTAQTAAHQWEQAKASLEVAAISLRDSLLPAFKAVSEQVQDLADWFSEMDAEAQANVISWTKWGIAAGPVIWAIGKLTSIIPTLITMFSTLNGLIMANPWVAAGTAVAALATLLAGKYLTSTNKAEEATSKFGKAVRESGKSAKEAAKHLEGLTIQKMFDNTISTLDALQQKSKQMKSELVKQFGDVQDAGHFTNATFQEWLETLDETYGRSGKTGRFLDLQDTIADLKEQKQLIREMNKLEVGRANVLNTVGGEYDRLSSFQKQQIRQEERQIDKIRTQLGLSLKYTEQEKQTKKSTQETNEELEQRKSILDKIWGNIPKAENVTGPLELIDQAIMGLPVSLNQLQDAQRKLEDAFMSATSQGQREKIQGYLNDLQEIIDKMNGVEEATENVEGANKKVQRAMQDFDMTFSSALEDAIVNFENLSDIAQGFFEDLKRIIARMAIVAPVKNAVSGVLSDWLPTEQNAKGGIFNGLTQIGNQMFGEAGPEAVLPLTRNSKGQLGVASAGGGGGGSVQVNVINYSGQDVQKKESRTANGGRKIDVMIGRAGAKDVENRGPLARSLEAAYGLSRNTRRRS